MIPDWLKFWESEDSERSQVEEIGQEYREQVRDGISIDDFRDGIVLKGGAKNQRKTVATVIKGDLDHLDEAPVPVFEATNMIPSDNSVHKSYPMTRIFIPTHYGSALLHNVYVFHVVDVDEGLNKEWHLVDDQEDAKIVLGERTVDFDPMEYLES